MEHELTLTVEEALRLPPLEKIRLVGGHGGLNRKIRSVEVMEVPDIINWVKEDEFLVTTAFSIKDDLAAQRNLLPALVAKNLAGIGIKPRRYLERIPDLMISQANELDFPLVEIPVEMPFSDVLGPIMAEIIHRQMDYLNRSEDMHRQLMEVMLKGGGMPEIAETLVELVGNPILVMGEDGKHLAYATPKEDPIPLDALLSNTSYKQVKVPIIVEDKYYGDILSWEKNGPLMRSHMAAIERFSTVAALRIVSDNAIFEVERRYTNEFLNEILEDSAASDATLIQRGRSMGWDLSKPVAVMVIDDGSSTNFDTHKSSATRNRLIRTLNIHFKGGVVGEKGDCVVVLVPGGAPQGELIMTTLTNLIPNHLKAGMGNLAVRPSHLPTSYREAVRALKVGLFAGRRQCITHYADLGIFKLLYLVDPRELALFANEVIGLVVEYDEKHGTSLMETLNAYYECNSSVKHTAQKLFVHQNTVLYRLRRIREIAGLDLQDRETRLRVEVALRIRRLQ